jgi:hypothetical protein
MALLSVIQISSKDPIGMPPTMTYLMAGQVTVSPIDNIEI